MKMTEKMKQSLVEVMKQEGIELSDEQLDEVAGGRSMTKREGDSLVFTGESDYRRLIMYLEYIKSLPEGSPEVLFDPSESYPHPAADLKFKFERQTYYKIAFADEGEK